MEKAIKFLAWIGKRTSSLQNNVRIFNDKYYYIDGQNHPNRNDLEELYAAFIKDVIG